MLVASGVGIAFGGLQAVQDLDMEVSTGSIHGLIGPNGAGKTTVFNLLSGFLRPDQGSIEFAGQRVERRGAHEMTRRGMARTFQTARLFPEFSVGENLHAALAGAGRHYDVTAVDRAKEWVSLRADDDLLPETLSQQDRKLLTIAMAVVSGPQLLLLDEPAAGLTEEESAHLMEVVERLRAEQGMTVLLIEHKMRHVMRVCDMITVMTNGRKLSEGAPAEVSSDPRVIEAYLGVSDA